MLIGGGAGMLDLHRGLGEPGFADWCARSRRTAQLTVAADLRLRVLRHREVYEDGHRPLCHASASRELENEKRPRALRPYITAHAIPAP